jgi:acyl-CoA synthetase (AMP-forming)/AMP-acid ligase II
MATTIPEMLASGSSAAIAIASPGGSRVSYQALVDNAARLAAQLRASGAVPGERIGILLPNGPAAAVALVASMGWFSAAPLNPKLRPAEIRTAAADLGVRRVIVPATEAPVLPGLELLPIELEGAHWSLRGVHAGPVAPEASLPAAEALVLQTSGTTGRPKTVPLTTANLLLSARNIAATLALGPGDRSLTAMPLFHIHGIVATLLAPLASGGSAGCTPNFDAFQFFDWLEELRPTWYSAVPAMHHLIVQRAGGKPRATSLRFARSSSSALPPSLMAEVETTFGVPCVEAYGMTEASHQIACNPLPPGIRKPGSVGLPMGIEVVIRDPAGQPVAAGGRGEVTIRGGTVTAGYAENAEANTSAFRDGWFRTGDEACVDEQGYLSLTGRLKELINRGGEKIAPREIEEALLRHPAVREAVAFAAPHATLGEEPAAAVVLAAEATPRELRAFLDGELAAFKVPRRIAVVEAIPLGPTGKMQRVGMAERLGMKP